MTSPTDEARATECPTCGHQSYRVFCPDPYHVTRRHERLDPSDSVDWGCRCGARGNHGWMGYAFHLQGMVERGELVPATPSEKGDPL